MDNISLSLLTLYEALANSPYTTITGDLDTTATSITIVDPAAIPSTFPCLLTIGYDTSTAETVLATSISGDTLTVTRGVDGTLQTWTAGSRISRVFTAKDLNDIQTNISRIAAAIGSASLDTEAQTLVGAINELDAGKCKLVKGYLSSSTGAFYSDSGFTTLVTDNENPNNLYLDLNSYRLYKYIAVGTGVLDVGYNLITVDDDLDVIRTPKYGVCSTAAGTAAKAVTINGITSLVTGLTIAVKFSNNNTAASPTLQVNSLTAKPIYQHGTTPAGTDDATTGWYAGAVVILAYDGTGWVMSKGVNNALDAGDVVYDNQETYASGTVGKEVSDLNGALTKDNLSSTLFETYTSSKVANANDAPYGQSSYDPNTANIPSGSNYGMIHHYYASGWKIQIAYDTNGNVYKRRNINNAGWQAWVKLTDMTDISAFSATNVAQYDTSMGGTLYDSSCTKNGYIVSASGRLTGIDVTASDRAYFLIPDGYRPSSQLRSFGYLYITNVGWVPSMATINQDGTVTLGYSPSYHATTVAFSATYYSN